MQKKLNELKKRRKGFSAKEIKFIMSQLNNAFKIMDENKIIHRDLKIENILIKYKDEIKKYLYLNYVIMVLVKF